jgi:hypothetical protein
VGRLACHPTQPTHLGRLCCRHQVSLVGEDLRRYHARKSDTLLGARNSQYVKVNMPSLQQRLLYLSPGVLGGRAIVGSAVMTRQHENNFSRIQMGNATYSIARCIIARDMLCNGLSGKYAAKLGAMSLTPETTRRARPFYRHLLA